VLTTTLSQSASPGGETGTWQRRMGSSGGQLERGKIRWPGKPYREAFRTIFNVSTDSALGFVNTRRAVVKLDGMNRKQFF
jgi:hypothetical protein